MALRDDEMNQPIIRPDFPEPSPGEDWPWGFSPTGEKLGPTGQPLMNPSDFNTGRPSRAGAAGGGFQSLGAIGSALANSMRPSPSLTAQPVGAPAPMPMGGGGAGFDASEPLINRSRGGVSPALGSVLRGGQGNDQTPLTQALMAQLLQRRGTPPRIV